LVTQGGGVARTVVSCLFLERSNDEDNVVEERCSESLELEYVSLAKQPILASVTAAGDRRVADGLVVESRVFRPFQHLDAAVELAAMVLGLCCWATTCKGRLVYVVQFRFVQR
jgi:hypothetical protein